MVTPPNRNPSVRAAARNHTIPADLLARSANPIGSNRGIGPGRGGGRRTRLPWRGQLPRYVDPARGIAESEYPGGRVDPLLRGVLARTKRGKVRGEDEDRRLSESDGLSQDRRERTERRLERMANRGERECKRAEPRRMEWSLSCSGIHTLDSTLFRPLGKCPVANLIGEEPPTDSVCRNPVRELCMDEPPPVWRNPTRIADSWSPM